GGGAVSDLLFGYNTNGFAHHRLEDALEILAELGYSSVALTLDHHALNPLDREEFARQLPGLGPFIEPLRRGAAIQTGARFLLDPGRKDQATLLTQARIERDKRFEFLCCAIGVARQLGIEVVSFWSGASLTDESRDALMTRLVDGCRTLADHAASK